MATIIIDFMYALDGNVHLAAHHYLPEQKKKNELMINKSRG